jgi:hypothetical protein
METPDSCTCVFSLGTRELQAKSASDRILFSQEEVDLKSLGKFEAHRLVTHLREALTFFLFSCASDVRLVFLAILAHLCAQ